MLSLQLVIHLVFLSFSMISFLFLNNLFTKFIVNQSFSLLIPQNCLFLLFVVQQGIEFLNGIPLIVLVDFCKSFQFSLSVQLRAGYWTSWIHISWLGHSWNVTTFDRSTSLRISICLWIQIFQIGSSKTSWSSRSLASSWKGISLLRCWSLAFPVISNLTLSIFFVGLFTNFEIKTL